MFRWLCVGLGLLMVGGGVNAVDAATASRQIQLQHFRPGHPDALWLRRVLRLHGFRVAKRASLSIQILSATRLQVQKGNYTQRYQLPTRLRSPRLRARMVMTYLGLFFETMQARQAAPSVPSPTPQRSAPSPRRTRQATPASNIPRRKVPLRRRKVQRRRRLAVVAPRQARRTRARPVPQRDAALKRLAGPAQDPSARPAPGARQEEPRFIKIRRPAIRRPAIRRPAIRRPAIRRVGPKLPAARPGDLQAIPRRVVPSRPHRVRRRPASRRRSTRATRVAALQPRVTRPKKRGLWGDVLSLDLGLSGGLRWSDEALVYGGGHLLLGFNAWRWTLRIDLALHTYALSLQEQRLILFVRPSFWLGWRIPLGAAERWLQLMPLLGVASELFVKEQPEKYLTWLEWGVIAGAQLHVSVAKRWSLFTRASLVLLPGGFGLAVSKGVSAPAAQLDLQLGLQVRL